MSDRDTGMDIVKFIVEQWSRIGVYTWHVNAPAVTPLHAGWNIELAGFVCTGFAAG